jgi:peptide/nickel transport system ATP-binding protein/oligopeptide transport system ATP-binding protein
MVAAVPVPASAALPLLDVRKLCTYFPLRGGLLRRAVAQVRAVDDVSFTLARGTTLGLVGESGCGKSTLGRTVLRLRTPTSGQVLFDGTDLAGLSQRALKPWRRRMQLVFQDPYASLSPRRTVAQTLREPLDLHRIGTPASRRDRVVELLEVVGLSSRVLDRYPHEFSGGQRQRVGIARALALDPQLIVADEPVSALDVSVQSQVLNLVRRVQVERGIAFLFISHDLAVVQHVSDYVGVMYLGRLVEFGPAPRIYSAPRHPYTQALLAAVPRVEGPPQDRVVLQGEIPSALRPPPGCAFHPRCPRAMEVCRREVPVRKGGGGAGDLHQVACHLY